MIYILARSGPIVVESAYNEVSPESLDPEAEREANADLIAAAPDLLTACKTALALLDHQGMYCEERAVLLQAVALAEGRGENRT